MVETAVAVEVDRPGVDGLVGAAIATSHAGRFAISVWTESASLITRTSADCAGMSLTAGRSNRDVSPEHVQSISACFPGQSSARGTSR
jgi:hypothetical protein